jgi:acyl-CoA dehydrogenase
LEFAYDETVERLRAEARDFLRTHVLPAEPVYQAQRVEVAPWGTPPVIEELKKEARARGLWNLFLPDTEHGAGLTNLQYAPIAELTGRSPWIAPEAMNCSAPDTGNMETLARFAQPASRSTGCGPCSTGRSARPTR